MDILTTSSPKQDDRWNSLPGKKFSRSAHHLRLQTPPRSSSDTRTSCLKQAITPDDYQDTPRICYTRNQTVGHHLVRARIRNPTPRRDTNRITIRYTPSFRSCSAPCTTPLCACCRMMSCKEVVFSSNNKPFKTISNTNCNTVCAVFLECTRCSKKNMYIGQTSRTIRERMAGHRTVHQTKNMPIYRHLKKKDHSFSDLKVTILEKAPPEELLDRERESGWTSQKQEFQRDSTQSSIERPRKSLVLLAFCHRCAKSGHVRIILLAS